MAPLMVVAVVPNAVVPMAPATDVLGVVDSVERSPIGASRLATVTFLVAGVPAGVSTIYRMSSPLGLVSSVSSVSFLSVSYTHLRAHETRHDLVCRLLL